MVFQDSSTLKLERQNMNKQNRHQKNKAKVSQRCMLLSNDTLNNYFHYLQMPRGRKKVARGKLMEYDRDNLSKAVDVVKAKQMSIRKAAEFYNVPKSTLHDRVTGKIEIEARPGRRTAFHDEIEEKIVTTVKEAAKQGIGICRRQLLARTGDLCRRFRVTPFKNVTPSKQWWEGLKKRHTELTIRRPEKLSSSRASMLNPVVVEKYMNGLGTLMDSLGLTNMPKIIWNCDETGRSFERRFELLPTRNQEMLSVEQVITEQT